MQRWHAAFLALLAVLVLPAGAFAAVSLSIAGGAAYTNTATPQLAITADNTTDANMFFSCTGAVWSASQPFQATYSSFNITSGEGCSSGDGLKPVHVKVQKQTGEETDNKTITLDTSVPTISGRTPANNTYTSNTLPAIIFDANDSGSGINDSNTVLKIGGSAVDLTGKKTATSTGYRISYAISSALSHAQTVSLEASAADNAGNTVSSSWSFTADLQGPSTASVSSSSDTNNANVKFSISNVSDSGIGVTQGNGKVAFSCTNSLPSTSVAFASDVNFDITSSSHGCSSGEGAKALYFWVADDLGNWMQTAAQKTVNYDITKPSTPSTPRITVGDSKIDLAWDAASDNLSGLKEYVIYQDNALLTTTTSTTYTVTGLSNGSTYSFSLSSRDNAGNQSDKSGSSAGVPVSSSGSSGNSGSSDSSDDSDSPAPTVLVDSTLPDVSFVNPSAGDNVKGIFEVKVKATDARAIYNVGLYVDSKDEKNLVAAKDVSENDEFAFSVDSSKWPDGSHELIAVATDFSPQRNKNEAKLAVVFANAEKKPEQAVQKKAKTEEQKPETVYSKVYIMPSRESAAKALALLGLGANASAEAANTVSNGTLERKIEISSDADSNGLFGLKVRISFTNVSGGGSLKVLEFVPKEIAEKASLIRSELPFNVIADDPVIEFDVNADANQSVSIDYWLEADLNKAEAEKLSKANLASKFSAPPVVLPAETKIDYASIKAAVEPKPDDLLSGFSGLLSLADMKLPFGLNAGMAVLGIIAVSLVFLFGASFLRKAHSPAEQGEPGEELGEKVFVEADETIATEPVTAPGQIIKRPADKKRKKDSLEKIEDKIKGLRSKEDL
ncbi:MAG: hypothetical protein HY394_02435 [Candidatus Diapherotrites archaeon]|nr:hypothetical protein [Candidatus Diapherotrites archaeon]